MQLKEIEKLAASVMEKAVDAKEVAGVNLLVLKDKATFKYAIVINFTNCF